MINMGVIGTGVWGKNHVRVISEIADANLVKISDVKGSNFDYLSSTFKINTTKDHKEILQDENIDAVSICTPVSRHYDLVKEALNAGKHVLVEKPITLDYKEAIELAELAKEKKLILMVGHIFRFNPAIHRLKEDIKKGVFGKIRFMYGSRMGLMTPRSDCGVIMDFALHDIDTFCFLLDGYPNEVTCVGSFYKEDDFEDVGFITLRFGKKILANVGVSWLTPKKVRDLWVIGEEKSASLDYLNQELNIYNKGIVPRYDSFGEFALVKREGDDHKPFIINKESLKAEVVHFLDCIKNKKKPIIDGFEGAKIIKIIDACYKSLKEKRTVGVDLVAKG